MGASSEGCGTDQEEVGMAKSIAEWKTAFEVLYKEMCEDLDASPVNTSVHIDVHECINGPMGPIRFNVRTRIEFD